MTNFDELARATSGNRSGGASRSAIQSFLAQAAAFYNSSAAVLDRIAFYESSYNVKAVNNWDSNAAAGTPSKGLMQFIKPTFDAYARQARAANPGAWKNQGAPNWNNWQHQALAASWAISVGKGSAWATYDKAKATASQSPLYGKGGGGGGCKQSSTRQAVRAALTARGLRHSSGDRTPAQNSAAGGVSNSDHLSTKCETWADDYVGTAGQMRAGKAYIEGRYKLKQVLIHDAGSGMHLHVAGYADGGGTGGNTGTSTNVGIGGAQNVGLTDKLGLDALGSALEAATRKLGEGLLFTAIVFIGGSLAAGLILFGAIRATGSDQRALQAAGMAITKKPSGGGAKAATK